MIDSGSKVDAMHPAYAAKLGLPVRKTEVGAQKIDGSTLETFRMAIAVFCFKTSWERFDPRRDLGDAFPHPQQCRHTICREGARLEDLHSCRYPPSQRFR